MLGLELVRLSGGPLADLREIGFHPLAEVADVRRLAQEGVVVTADAHADDRPRDCNGPGDIGGAVLVAGAVHHGRQIAPEIAAVAEVALRPTRVVEGGEETDAALPVLLFGRRHAQGVGDHRVDGPRQTVRPAPGQHGDRFDGRGAVLGGLAGGPQVQPVVVVGLRAQDGAAEELYRGRGDPAFQLREASFKQGLVLILRGKRVEVGRGEHPPDQGQGSNGVAILQLGGGPKQQCARLAVGHGRSHRGDLERRTCARRRSDRDKHRRHGKDQPTHAAPSRSLQSLGGRAWA